MSASATTLTAPEGLEAEGGAAKVRVAMLSFAHVHAEGYANAVRDNARAEISVVWDELPERGKQMAERYGAPFEPDLERALGREDVDGGVVDAPTNIHQDIYYAACAAGRHIFTEKALTIRTRDADAVVKAVEESGIRFMVSLPARTRSETLFLRKVVDEGLIGDITYIRTRIAHSGALDRWFGGDKVWFTEPEPAGGGGLFDLGCHTVDVTRWLGGPPRAVAGRLNSITGIYPNVDDNAAIVVEFESGVLATMECAWVQRKGPSPMEIYGTEGYAAVGTLAGAPVIQSTKVAEEDLRDGLHPHELPAALPSPLEQWLSSILEGAATTIGVRDGRNLTELLEACYLSSGENRAVTFPIGG
jgi:1,5-anhydro-D-fructose reductase (1,5-anhydro-D-mannitol-forming)